MAHTLMGNRNGLIADVEATEFNGHAEPQAALRMLGHTVRPGSTAGTDKAADRPDFVRGLRRQKITPHVAQRAKGSAIDKRATRQPGYRVSLQIRKRIEEGFGWLKTVDGLRKTKLMGREKLSAP